MKEEIIKMVAELTSLKGPAGDEKEVVLYLRDRIKDYVDELEVDAFGNIVAMRKGLTENRPIMIPAHMDEIALIVQKIENNGFIRFTAIGYPNPLTLSGRNVNVGGKYTGVVGVRNFHTTPPDERDKLPKKTDFYIDVGAKNVAEVKKMGIRVGTPISFTNELRQLGNSDRFSAKAVDDRLGCAIVLLLFEALSSIDLPSPLCGCFTVQEEVGLRGAQMSVHKVNPGLAFVVDCPLAEDTPDQGQPSDTTVCLGKGPVINVKEFIPEWSLGTIHHPVLVDHLIRLAENRNIPYQLGMIIGGVTDAVPIHLHGGGVPTVFLGAPLRYAHSQIETFDLDDVKSTIDLLKEAVISITPGTVFKTV